MDITDAPAGEKPARPPPGHRHFGTDMWHRVEARRRAGRLVHWLGAVLVGLVALGFADLANGVAAWRTRFVGVHPFAMLVVSPVVIALSLALTRRFFDGAQGSGIPQVIAALAMKDGSRIDRVLSLRVAIGKIGLTLAGLAAGASIGREGPTIQIGAAVMHALGRFARLESEEARRALVLAGGAAGIAGAFNTPLAGIVFAIEELSRSFESRTSGVVFTSVLIAGATSLALVGNYTYFGTTSVQLPFGRSLVAVAVCGVLGGLAGGGFSQLLIWMSRGLPAPLGRRVARRPILFAVCCGLAIAAIGLATDGATYGTGYTQARLLITGHDGVSAWYFAAKFAATLISYASGIPGGIFAPSLAVGAGLGGAIAHLLPGVGFGAVVLLGMVAYFSGVVQAPITATVIVMEMVDNQQVTIGLMATAVLAFAVSRLVCRRPLYETLAHGFIVATGAEIAEPSEAVEELHEVAGTMPDVELMHEDVVPRVDDGAPAPR